MNKVVFAHKEQSKNTSSPNEMQHKIIRNGSFVSMLIRGDMPFKIGLPYREFFIWCDDYEYSYRMFSHGFIGIYAEESVGLHATTENYTPALEDITAKSAMEHSSIGSIKTLLCSFFHSSTKFVCSDV